MRLFDEIEDVVVPVVPLDDTPTTGESLGEGRNSRHQPVSVMSFGSRTRL